MPTEQIDRTFLAHLFDVDEAEIASIDGIKFDLARDTEGLTDNELACKLLWERHNNKIRALADALKSEDDLGKVIRGHIHVEHELQQVIFFAAPRPDQLPRRQRFTDKIQLASVLGLNPDFAKPLNAANDLRNDFAHRLDTKLTKEVASKLIAALSPAMKERFDTLLTNTISGLPKHPGFKAQFEALLGFSPPEQEHPLYLLKGEVRARVEAQLAVLVFLCACLRDWLTSAIGLHLRRYSA